MKAESKSPQNGADPILTKGKLHYEGIVGPPDDGHDEQHREPLHRPDTASAPFRPIRATAASASAPMVVIIVSRY